MSENNVLAKELIDSEVIVDLSEVKSDLTPISVLNNMITGKTDVDLKSDISNPKALALLKTISKVYGSLDFTLAHDYIEFFIKHFLRYRISKNRLSRIEVKDVLSAQVALERQKLLEKPESQFK